MLPIPSMISGEIRGYRREGETAVQFRKRFIAATDCVNNQLNWAGCRNLKDKMLFIETAFAARNRLLATALITSKVRFANLEDHNVGVMFLKHPRKDLRVSS